MIFDPFRVMQETDCAYPRLKGLSGQQIAALHAWKMETIAVGYRLYKDLPLKQAAPIVAAWLEEVARNVEQAQSQFDLAQAA